MKHVLVTGGAGYVGCVLVPILLKRGYQVTVYDILYYGSKGLPDHPNLDVIEGDIRNTSLLEAYLKGVDCVIHLACISNDPSFILNSEFSKEVNFDCFEPMVRVAKNTGVQRFIYVSTSSVYGVSEAPEVTEEHPLVPLTDYNKFKGMCEPILNKFLSDDFTTVTIRPATVSGFSPRLRLDLSVNILTNLAVNKGEITVFGGSQMRPNIHIDDASELYADLIEIPKGKIAGEIFNASQENYTIAQMAQIVKKVVEEEFPERDEIKILTTPSNDVRSYHVTSKKILDRLGWKPKRTAEDAVRDLCRAFKGGKIPDSLNSSHYFNIKRMQELAAH